MSDFCQDTPSQRLLQAPAAPKRASAPLLLAGVLLAGTWTACGSQPGSQAAGFDHQHAAWDQVLEQHVYPDGPSTVFDYQALSQDRSQFDDYLEQLQSVDRSAFQAWNEDQQLAFLINAYNAFTVEWVLRHYPVGSIRETADHPWGEAFIGLLGGERTLDQIEHEMIRPVFGEPLIHFAVNCAAAGCPPLRGEAYVAGRLDEQLKDSAKTFLENRAQNRVEDGTLYLSPIFDWYGDDFDERYGGVLPFLARHLTDDPRTASRIRGGELEVRYVEYDWSLNEPSPAPQPER